VAPVTWSGTVASNYDAPSAVCHRTHSRQPGLSARLEALTRRLLELARADMHDQAEGESTVAAALRKPGPDAGIDVRLGGDPGIVGLETALVEAAPDTAVDPTGARANRGLDEL